MQYDSVKLGRQAITPLLIAVIIGALVCTPVQAQQVPIPKTAAEVPGPPPGTAMTKAYVQRTYSVIFVNHFEKWDISK